jgi:alpha-N-arabinofuranosidase
MYKDHQENTLLGSYITTPNLADKGTLPKLIESASVKEDGTIIATVVNTSADESADIHCQIADFALSNLSAEILTGDIHDYNSFENKNVAYTKVFSDYEVLADGFKTTIPPCSVAKFVIK